MIDAQIINSTYANTPVTSVLIDNKLEFISFERNSGLRSIFLGKVDHVVKNLNAAFVKFRDNEIGYLPLDNICRASISNRIFSENDSLKAGDEVLVQLESEAVKMKKAKLSTSLSISGKYSVVTLGRSGVGSSVKLSDNLRHLYVDRIKSDFLKLSEEYTNSFNGVSVGVIIRTEASELSDDCFNTEVLADIKYCIDKLITILSDGKSRTIYSCLYSSSTSSLEKAISFLRTKDITEYKISEDTGIFGIKSKIDSLRQNRIWLKSGGFLIIEQLESFNAIDVNTGKAIKGKDSISEKVNFEAADEIMRQIRLRNLTGMILIDFINMKDDKQYERLIKHIKELCRKDIVHTNFIDVTGLGIVELTRTKNDKSLKEILHEVEK